MDPLDKFQRWYREAKRAAVPLREAMALATVDAKGRPSVRYVLLKGIERDRAGFVFYTNAGSRKGRELRARPYAALAFYWDATGRQVRCEGRVKLLPSSDADRYWASRPRASQIASAASTQSAPLVHRADLLGEVKRLENLYRDRPIPRPTDWKGYVLEAARIEFWTRREPRLHDRELYVRSRDGWTLQRLQP